MKLSIFFVVEGQTEEKFVNRVLIPQLATISIQGQVRPVLTSAKHDIEHRGGPGSYAQVKKDITLWMEENPSADAFFTTMFDLYKLPKGFPGRQAALRIDDPLTRVKSLEDSMSLDIHHPRFIPYIQLHEFEALLFSDPQKLDTEFIEHDSAIANLIRIASEFVSPELINDGDETAPSKRIIREIPEYKEMNKSAGPLVAEKIGLTTLRAKCGHFNEWLGKLEKLAPGVAL